jgi:murein DD-endopeptidase MepM/ murein hydrolase activator NlpD
VWIDHGNNLITRYAHLNKINSKIKVGQTVKHGDLLGFVGVSGTGQNLPGRAKFPHLHFEIWLDGKYLGYGLTPAETVGIFENIFGTGT